jgi:ssDNA-binding Zn-finger/Zn-ribbon topoisomerase 1
MNKNKVVNPDCPKCGKPMRLMSTGSMVRTFYCCGERKIVEREDVKC